MRKSLRPLLVVILLGLAGFAFYLWQQGRTYQPVEQPSVAAPADAPAPVAPIAPEVQYPVPETAEKPLPPLEKSDPEALAALGDVFGKKAVKQFFLPQEVIRRIVITVDNLPREVISVQLQATRPVGGKLQIAGTGDKVTLAQANYKRYASFIRLAESVDAKTFATMYVGMYPLFQQAYRDLGYPNGHFNDRLVTVIDHMLVAPESDGPIALVQPHVFYKFADPELESLSAGHKLMLRMGNENAAKVKKKLAEIRSELVTLAPKEE